MKRHAKSCKPAGGDEVEPEGAIALAQQLLNDVRQKDEEIKRLREELAEAKAQTLEETETITWTRTRKGRPLSLSEGKRFFNQVEAIPIGEPGAVEVTAEMADTLKRENLGLQRLVEVGRKLKSPERVECVVGVFVGMAKLMYQMYPHTRNAYIPRGGKYRELVGCYPASAYYEPTAADGFKEDRYELRNCKTQAYMNEAATGMTRLLELLRGDSDRAVIIAGAVAADTFEKNRRKVLELATKEFEDCIAEIPTLGLNRYLPKEAARTSPMIEEMEEPARDGVDDWLPEDVREHAAHWTEEEKKKYLELSELVNEEYEGIKAEE